MARDDDNWGPVAFDWEERYAPDVRRDADRHRDDGPTPDEYLPPGDQRASDAHARLVRGTATIQHARPTLAEGADRG